MNDHLYYVHGKVEFRPKRLNGSPDEREINELMAKFIINSNSAFKIVEDKYLKVSLKNYHLKNLSNIVCTLNVHMNKYFLLSESEFLFQNTNSIRFLFLF